MGGTAGGLLSQPSGLEAEEGLGARHACSSSRPLDGDRMNGNQACAKAGEPATGTERFSQKDTPCQLRGPPPQPPFLPAAPSSTDSTDAKPLWSRRSSTLGENCSPLTAGATRVSSPSALRQRHDFDLLIAQRPAAAGEPPLGQAEHGLDVPRAQEHLLSSFTVRGTK